MEINVKDYGALGNGIDYTKEIQKALNEGGNIYIPKGEYLISSPLVIYKNTHIRMDEDTILQRSGSVTINQQATSPELYTSGPYAIFTNGEKTDVYYDYNGNGNISISGGVIDCNGENEDTPSNGICFAHAKNIHISNITIKNVRSGHHIEINSCSLVTIVNCKFHNHHNIIVDSNKRSHSEAIQIDLAKNIQVFPLFGGWDNKPCTFVNVRECYFAETGDGVGSHACTVNSQHQSIQIEDNFFYNIKYSAIKPFNWTRCNFDKNIVLNTVNGSAIEAENLYDSIISNCILKGISGNGVKLINSNNIEVIGGEIKECKRAGVSVNTESGRIANASGSNVKLSNISIYNGSTIGINVASNNTMVMGCSVYNNGSHGLYVHDCENSIIQGCAIKENASYGITSTVNSVSTIIKNCIFLNNGGTDVLIGGSSAGYAQKNYVSGNTFCDKKTSGYNIWVQSVSKNNVIVNNDMCMGNLTTKKKIDSSSTYVSGNIEK